MRVRQLSGSPNSDSRYSMRTPICITIGVGVVTRETQKMRRNCRQIPRVREEFEDLRAAAVEAAAHARVGGCGPCFLSAKFAREEYGAGRTHHKLDTGWSR